MSILDTVLCSRTLDVHYVAIFLNSIKIILLIKTLFYFTHEFLCKEDPSPIWVCNKLQHLNEGCFIIIYLCIK